MPVSGDADSTTRSAISSGKIEIRSNPNQDISGLSRDTTNSLNALGKIFDKATVQEKQELANVFGEVAFKAIGDLGLKEDNPNKVALKSIVGGIMSKISGGNFTTGATSAGFTQIIQKQLANIKDPAILQWVNGIIGAAVSKVIGGNVRIGASIAVNDERNNYLSHEQQRQKIEELNKATTDEEKDAIKKKWDKISDDQTNNANIEVVGSIVYSKDNSEIYIAGEAPPVVVTAKRYVFDWKAIWDGVAGLARGVTGVQGEDYFDRSGRYKYWYSVGNRAMPLALQAAGIS